eukprot:scaffold2848_cov352-Pavlova_lutheri.AAC.8
MGKTHAKGDQPRDFLREVRHDECTRGTRRTGTYTTNRARRRKGEVGSEPPARVEDAAEPKDGTLTAWRDATRTWCRTPTQGWTQAWNVDLIEDVLLDARGNTRDFAGR